MALPMLPLGEAAAVCSIPASTFEEFCRRADGPRKVKIGKRVYVRPADLLIWAEDIVARNILD